MTMTDEATTTIEAPDEAREDAGSVTEERATPAPKAGQGVGADRGGFYRFYIDDPDEVFPPSGASLRVSRAEDNVRGSQVDVPFVLHMTTRVPQLRCPNHECSHRVKHSDRAYMWYPEPPLRNLTLAKSRVFDPEAGKAFEKEWNKRYQTSWLCPHCRKEGRSVRGVPVKPSPQLPTPFRDLPVVKWLTHEEVERLDALLDPDREAEDEFDTLEDSLGKKRKVRVGKKGGPLVRRVKGEGSVFGPGSDEERLLGPTIKYSFITSDKSYRPYDGSADVNVASRNAALEWKLREAMVKDDSGMLAELLKEAGVMPGDTA